MTRFFTSVLLVLSLISGFFLGTQSPTIAQMNQKQASSVEFYTLESQLSSTDLTVLSSWKYLANEGGLVVRLFPATEPDLVTLLIENQTRELLTVRISNNRRDQLYEDVRSARQTWGRWRLNLSELPDGSYTLHIQAGKQKISHPFVIETRSPVVYAHDRAVVF